MREFIRRAVTVFLIFSGVAVFEQPLEPYVGSINALSWAQGQDTPWDLFTEDPRMIAMIDRAIRVGSIPVDHGWYIVRSHLNVIEVDGSDGNDLVFFIIQKISGEGGCFVEKVVRLYLFDKEEFDDQTKEGWKTLGGNFLLHLEENAKHLHNLLAADIEGHLDKYCPSNEP